MMGPHQALFIFQRGKGPRAEGVYGAFTTRARTVAHKKQERSKRAPPQKNKQTETLQPERIM